MARCFILEDDPTRVESFKVALRGHEVMHAWSVEEGMALFAPPYDVILLDHDLGDAAYASFNRKNTGAEFARYVARTHTADPSTRVVVHSWNPVGALVMLWALQGAGWTVNRTPFSAELLLSLTAALTPALHSADDDEPVDAT